MSTQREFWKSMVDEYNQVVAKIYDIETRFSQGMLLSSPNDSQYSNLKKRREQLLKSMGAEFPNLYQHNIILRENKIPFNLTAEYWENRYTELEKKLDDLGIQF